MCSSGVLYLPRPAPPLHHGDRTSWAVAAPPSWAPGSEDTRSPSRLSHGFHEQEEEVTFLAANNQEGCPIRYVIGRTCPSPGEHAASGFTDGRTWVIITPSFLRLGSCVQEVDWGELPSTAPAGVRAAGPGGGRGWSVTELRTPRPTRGALELGGQVGSALHPGIDHSWDAGFSWGGEDLGHRSQFLERCGGALSSWRSEGLAPDGGICEVNHTSPALTKLL